MIARVCAIYHQHVDVFIVTPPPVYSVLYSKSSGA